MRQLAVYMNERLAGVLTENHPGMDYVFRYEKAYLSQGGPSVSVTLPPREASYESKRLFPFFANMLPEGANRKEICRSQRIDEEDLFSLLAFMADKDFIGAVHIKVMK